MLVIDPSKRISTQQALLHSYVNMWYTRAEAEEMPSEQYDPMVEDRDQTIEQWMGQLSRIK
jgi:hypothetical protein